MPLTGWRRWAFPLITATAVPLLLLGLVELGLRVGGYGEPGAFFVPIEGRDGMVTTNRRFGWRFFPRELAREPVAVEMARDKPEGTLRVFVLGGSAALGTPDDGFGLARVLEVLLEESYPEQPVEVINAAMAAVNSHVVREIARDCARYEPDAFVVYMGNNEVVGPYGPGSIFGRFSPGLRTIRAAIWARQTRLGQLLQAPTRWLGSEGGLDSEEPSEWRGLEMFAGREVPADDPRLEATYRHFRHNLEDIVEIGRDAGAWVAVSTVAVNLLDSPPFGTAEESEALDAYRLGVDPGQAPGSVSAQGASAPLRVTSPEVVEDHLRRARNLDPLRFRADDDLNGIVLEVAGLEGADGITVVDGESALGDAATVPGSPGDDLFWEHVHLRFLGTYTLALAVLEGLAETPALAATPARQPPSADEVAAALGLTSWDRYRMADTIVRMTGRPPFTGQLGHDERHTRRRRELASLRTAWQRDPAAAVEAKRRALELRPDDLVLRRSWAQLLHDRGRPAAAAEEWRRLVERVPGVASWHSELGFALADAGDLAQAEAELRRALDLSGRSAEARVNLGEVLERQGKTGVAGREYRAALESNPSAEPARLALARWLEAEGAVEAAIEQYSLALKARPDSPLAHRRFAGLLDRQGRFEEAEAAYRDALEADPYQPAVHNNLGYLFERQGRLEPAIEQYRSAVALDPTYALARFNLGDALFAAGLPAEAADAYRLGLALDPSNQQARRNLELALEQGGG